MLRKFDGLQLDHHSRLDSTSGQSFVIVLFGLTQLASLLVTVLVLLLNRLFLFSNQ